MAPALASRDLPERPPQLPVRPTGFTACWGPEALDVYAGSPAIRPAAAQALLAQSGDSLVLITASNAHPITPGAATAMGYSTAAARPVPGAWLSLVPPGAPLDLIAPSPVDPGRGVPGLGSAGEVVTDATGRPFQVGDGVLSPYANYTSELLAPAPAREVGAAEIAAATPGPSVGIAGAPTSPPPLVPREEEVAACVSSSEGQVSIAADVADAATTPSPAHELGGSDEGKAPDGTGGEGAVAVSWHFRPGQGALVGPTTLDQPRESGEQGTGGIRVVDAGISYPVTDLPALDALGYQREQTVLLPEAWLALTVRGGELATSPSVP